MITSLRLVLYFFKKKKNLRKAFCLVRDPQKKATAVSSAR